MLLVIILNYRKDLKYYFLGKSSLRYQSKILANNKLDELKDNRYKEITNIINKMRLKTFHQIAGSVLISRYDKDEYSMLRLVTDLIYITDLIDTVTDLEILEFRTAISRKEFKEKLFKIYLSIFEMSSIPHFSLKKKDAKNVEEFILQEITRKSICSKIAIQKIIVDYSPGQRKKILDCLYKVAINYMQGVSLIDESKEATDLIAGYSMASNISLLKSLDSLVVHKDEIQNNDKFLDNLVKSLTQMHFSHLFEDALTDLIEDESTNNPNLVLVSSNKEVIQEIELSLQLQRKSIIDLNNLDKLLSSQIRRISLLRTNLYFRKFLLQDSSKIKLSLDLVLSYFANQFINIIRT